MKKLSNEKMAEICQAIQRVDASRPKGSRIDYVFAKRLQKIFYQLWEGDSSAGDKLVRSIRDGGFVLDEHYYTAVNLLIAKKISDEQFFRFILYCRGGCPDVAWEMFLKAVCDKKISYDLFEKVVDILIPKHLYHKVVQAVLRGEFPMEALLLLQNNNNYSLSDEAELLASAYIEGKIPKEIISKIVRNGFDFGSYEVGVIKSVIDSDADHKNSEDILIVLIEAGYAFSPDNDDLLAEGFKEGKISEKLLRAMVEQKYVFTPDFVSAIFDATVDGRISEDILRALVLNDFDFDLDGDLQQQMFDSGYDFLVQAYLEHNYPELDIKL